MNKSHYITVNGVNVLTGEEFNVLGLLFKVIELKEERVTYSSSINGMTITLTFEYYRCFDTDYYKMMIDRYATMKLFEPNNDMTEFVIERLNDYITGVICSCEIDIKRMTTKLEAFRAFKELGENDR